MSNPARAAGVSGSSVPAIEGKGKWMALLAAFLGWMFDGVEIGLFPLVARPSLQDLLQVGSQDDQIGRWISVITAAFLVGAATGGVLFGWLGDRIGRVRAMTLSVLTYAIFTGLCGVAGTATQVAIFRFIAALGMGGEWSLGVALVMEIWPNRNRAILAGLIGAAANVGFLLIGAVGVWLAAPGTLGAIGSFLGSAGLPERYVETLVDHSGWRLLMIVGAAPAALTFLIRLFVPESASWEREHGRGATSHWAARDLIGVLIGAIGAGLIIYLWGWDRTSVGDHELLEHSLYVRIGGTLVGLVIAVVGYIYPVVRYLQRHEAAVQSTRSGSDAAEAWKPVIRRMLLAACLSGVALLGTWGSLQWVASWADKLTAGSMPEAKAYTQIWSGLGAVVGCILGALMGDWFGRRVTYTLLCILSLASCLMLFQTNSEYGSVFLAWSFIAGAFTASFYGWLPLYLPELFRTNVRATGQGFGFNFGRIMAAIGVLQTGNLMALFSGNSAQDSSLVRMAEALRFQNLQDYPLACSYMSMIYLVGVVIIWLTPETRGQPLPE